MSAVERGALIAYWIIGYGKISAREAKDWLGDRGCDVSIRTVQRDLHKLSCVLPLVVENEDQKGRVYYWKVHVGGGL